MKDQRVVVGGGEKLWCKNSKRGFNVRLTGEKMRERRREEREAAGKWWNELGLGMFAFIPCFLSFSDSIEPVRFGPVQSA